MPKVVAGYCELRSGEAQWLQTQLGEALRDEGGAGVAGADGAGPKSAPATLPSGVRLISQRWTPLANRTS